MDTTIMGLGFRDTGKQNGKYYHGLRVEGSGLKA